MYLHPWSHKPSVLILTHPHFAVFNVFCRTVVMNQLELEKKVQNRIASCPQITSFSRAGVGPLFSVMLLLRCPSDGSQSEEWSNILFLQCSSYKALSIP